MQKVSKGSHHGHHHVNEHDLHDDLEKLKSLLSDTTADLRGRARHIVNDSYDRLRDKGGEAVEGFSEYVAKKPFKTVGSAVLVGFLLGFLFRR